MASEDAARHLDWDGCANARDLGGFAGARGTTRWGAVVRSDNLDDLTDSGWAALREHGIRTIVDLRDPSEHVRSDAAHRPETVSAPVFAFDDAEFWEHWHARAFAPAGFYRAALERWPTRFAHAVAAVGDAPEGGVLVHCHVGRDRTGLVAALLLSIAGVPLDAIAADYALSAERLRPRYARWLGAELDEETRARLERENHNGSDPDALLGALDGLDVEAYLRAGGVSARQVAGIRARLL
jgi:hypothetical protein